MIPIAKSTNRQEIFQRLSEIHSMIWRGLGRYSNTVVNSGEAHAAGPWDEDIVNGRMRSGCGCSRFPLPTAKRTLCVLRFCPAPLGQYGVRFNQKDLWSRMVQVASRREHCHAHGFKMLLIFDALMASASKALTEM